MLLTFFLIQTVWCLAPFFSQRETIDRVNDGVHYRSYFIMFNENAPFFGMKKEKLQGWLKTAMPELRPENVQHIYEITWNFRGFSIWATNASIEQVLAHQFVKYVEEDQVMRVSGIFTSRIDWGQLRINQGTRRNLVTIHENLFSGSTYPDGGASTETWNWASVVNQSYRVPNTGSAARIWIVDTGILQTHHEFQINGQSRVVVNQDFVTSEGPGTDCNGHGTHCAGSAAGLSRGIATEAEIGNIRVLDCLGMGSNSNVIAGINYVANNQVMNRINILSLSLIGNTSISIDNAINNIASMGIIPVVSAGNNDNQNACNYSPARATHAITVGASTSQDVRASFSNSGSCLDVFAPGESIHSSWSTSPTTYNTISGTSMATSLTAGAIAIYSTMNGNINSHVTNVKNAIRSTGIADVITGNLLFGTPNILINSNWS